MLMSSKQYLIPEIEELGSYTSRLLKENLEKDAIIKKLKNRTPIPVITFEKLEEAHQKDIRKLNLAYDEYKESMKSFLEDNAKRIEDNMKEIEELREINNNQRNKIQQMSIENTEKKLNVYLL